MKLIYLCGRKQILKKNQMKKLLVVALALILFGGCHNYKKDALQLQVSKDSLLSVNANKDSSILEFLSDFNEIQSSLDTIKKLEKLVTVQTDRGSELNGNQKQQIMEDIALLNNLIQKNKEMVANLQRKLNNSNSKISELESVVSELKLMVSNLEEQVRVKDNEILRLNDEVNKLTANVRSLNEKVDNLSMESRQKSETIATQTTQLNKAYYVYGTLKELKDNGVIEKSGGVLGLGKTPAIRKDFNKDYFTEIDIRKFGNLPLMVKKARVVSVHPAGSFHVTGEKTSDTLFIDDKAEFWQASKYLVVITD
jgi:outer membrane murein-binding lipoprotein Lpp